MSATHHTVGRCYTIIIHALKKCWRDYSGRVYTMSIKRAVLHKGHRKPSRLTRGGAGTKLLSMTPKVRLLAIVLICLVSSVSRLVAHHSFAAQYDRTKPVTLKGTVTKVEWMNPHVYFYVEVKDKDRVATWAIEGAAPAMLYRNGWRADSLKVGDQVTVEGWLAKDGSNLANMRTTTLANGKTVFGASSGGDSR